MRNATIHKNHKMPFKLIKFSQKKKRVKVQPKAQRDEPKTKNKVKLSTMKSSRMIDNVFCCRDLLSKCILVKTIQHFPAASTDKHFLFDIAAPDYHLLLFCFALHHHLPKLNCD